MSNSFFLLGCSRTSNRSRSNLRDSSIKIPQSFARNSGPYVSALKEILKAFPKSFSRRRNLSLYKRRCVYYGFLRHCGTTTDFSVFRSTQKKRPKRLDDKKSKSAYANESFKTSDKGNALIATEEADEEVAVVVVEAGISIDVHSEIIDHHPDDTALNAFANPHQGGNLIPTSHQGRAEVAGILGH